MSSYESLIDPADFGVIADYIRGDTDINFLLHVRTESMLATLAEQLDQCRLRHEGAGGEVSKVLDRLLEAGSLRLSVRESFVFLGRYHKHEIVPSSIPRAATCYVIYSPPFYLVHTPGLFEGTLHRQSMSQCTTADLETAPVRIRRK